jgi:RHS repeat-associated protein
MNSLFFLSRIRPTAAACVICLLSGGLYAQPASLPAAYTGSTVNYVREWIPTSPESSGTNFQIGALSDVKQQTQYFDGFGRPTQVVLKQASPLGNDIVQAYTYNAVGQEQYHYLMFTSNAAAAGDVTTDGSFKMDAFQQQAAFYNTLLSGQAGETNVSGNLNWAYGQKNFEESPMNRVQSAYAPGVSWVGSQGGSAPQRNTQQQFLANTSTDNVQIWNVLGWSVSTPEANVIPSNGGVYGAGQLYKTIITDEQGNQQIQFKDTYGQVILQKSQLSATADNGSGSGHAGWLCTYYVYDDHGNLRFVITPDLVAQMAAAGVWTITQGEADELCYRFEYDQLNRMVVKKTPGTPTGSQGEVWMVYDQRNRMVMEQTGNLRGLKKWIYIQYDNLDRPIAKGFITDPSNYNNLSYHLTNAASSGNNGSGVSAWPVVSSYTSELLVQTYYDGYSNIPAALPQTTDVTTNGAGNAIFITTYSLSPPYAEVLTPSLMVQGLVTGANVEVMGSNGGQYLPTVSFYDEKGRTIQTQNINYTGGKDISTTQFDWSGKVLATNVSDSYSSTTNPQTHNVTSAMSYDAMGRLTTVTRNVTSTVNGVAVNSAATQTVSQTYDELGRPKIRTLGNNLESLTYDYNIRGWLLGINRGYIGGSASNYFGLEVGYDKAASVASGNSFLHPVYNGNVGGVVWKSKGDATNRKYDLVYDNVNRLTSAAFLQNSSGSSWDNGFIDFSVSGITYDANGNMAAMNQNGFAQGGSKPIDNLAYNYVGGAGNSNRLSYVNDAVNVTTSTLGDFHFPGGAKGTGTTDYNYDADGNESSDNNRSITAIARYAYQDLPQTISAAKGSVTYVYDAAGNKLQKNVIENATINGTATTITTTTRYCGGFVYKSVSYTGSAFASLNYTDVLQYVSEDEGRLRFKPALGNVAASFVHDYFIRDNLGNVRVGITDEPQQDIYPAATGETVTYNGGQAQSFEANYYTFTSSDFVSNSSLTWFPGVTGNSYQNENNGGTPANTVDPYSNVTANSSMVFQLCGNTSNNPSGDRFGLGITLKVMAGDQINLYGKSFWHNSGSLPAGGYPVSAVLTSLLTAFSGSAAVSSAGHGVLDGSALNISSTGTTATLLSPMMTNSSSQSGAPLAPYAGINWIIFDDQFRPVSVGFSPVGTTTDNVLTHNIPTITIPKNGYIYVYVSNQSTINVYFDNLQVVHTRGAMLEETHYYPIGLAMAGISDRAWNKGPNYFHFQSKEMQDQEWNDGSGLEEYDFGAREYDPQLGRWPSQDPLQQFASPYAGMGNNWMAGVDRNGKSFWSALADVGAFIGLGGIGYVGASLESHGNWDVSKWNNKWWQGALTADIIAASLYIGVAAAAGEIAVGADASAAATIEVGAAEGVGQNLVMAEVSAQLTTGHNLTWDDAFAASVSGAISGAFQSQGMQNGFDNLTSTGSWSWDSPEITPNLLQGVTSNVVGGALSTFAKDEITGNGKNLGTDEIGAFLGNSLGQIAHQGAQALGFTSVATDNHVDLPLWGRIGNNLISNSASALIQQVYSDIYQRDEKSYDPNFFHQFLDSFLPTAIEGWGNDMIFPAKDTGIPVH